MSLPDNKMDISINIPALVGLALVSSIDSGFVSGFRVACKNRACIEAVGNHQVQPTHPQPVSVRQPGLELQAVDFHSSPFSR